MINQLCKEAYETAKTKGWHDEPRETGTLLALIHAEVSEALEADRKGDSENFAEELADVCIRVFAIIIIFDTIKVINKAKMIKSETLQE